MPCYTTYFLTCVVWCQSAALSCAPDRNPRPSQDEGGPADLILPRCTPRQAPSSHPPGLMAGSGCSLQVQSRLAPISPAARARAVAHVPLLAPCPWPLAATCLSCQPWQTASAPPSSVALPCWFPAAGGTPPAPPGAFSPPGPAPAFSPSGRAPPPGLAEGFRLGRLMKTIRFMHQVYVPNLGATPCCFALCQQANAFHSAHQARCHAPLPSLLLAVQPQPALFFRLLTFAGEDAA